MSKNKTWEVLTEPWMEGALASLISLNLIVGIMLMAKRMLLLEASGASVGPGVQSVTQTVGRQGVVFLVVNGVRCLERLRCRCTLPSSL
jgi:hypothetical protein